MEMFEIFLIAFLKEEYDYRKLNATILIKDGRRNAYHYYINQSDNGDVEVMINQIDRWVARQGSPVNNYEELVENILSDHEMEVNKNTFFTVIVRDGIKEDDYFTMVENKENIPKAKFQRLQIDMEGITRFEGDRNIYVDLNIAYENVEECNKEFNMVKLFLNSLEKKMNKKLKQKKDIYKFYNLSEQTFYNWKKKNPAVYEAMCNAYFYKDIKEIVNALSGMPSLLSKNWGTKEPMRYLDGKEF